MCVGRYHVAVHLDRNNSVPDSEDYRARAFDCLTQANGASELKTRDLLLKLAMAYAKLAELSEQNARTDLVYETPTNSRMQ